MMNHDKITQRENQDVAFVLKYKIKKKRIGIEKRKNKYKFEKKKKKKRNPINFTIHVNAWTIYYALQLLLKIMNGELDST